MIWPTAITTQPGARWFGVYFLKFEFVLSVWVHFVFRYGPYEVHPALSGILILRSSSGSTILLLVPLILIMMLEMISEGTTDGPWSVNVVSWDSPEPAFVPDTTRL